MYNRYIEEVCHVAAMFNLGHMLESGTHGGARDTRRAVDLYTRAIKEGNHVEAMLELANMLQNV